MDRRDREFFEKNGYLNLGKVLSDEEVVRAVEFYDRDRSECDYLWRSTSNQTLNCDALVSWPEVDEIIRPMIRPSRRGSGAMARTRQCARFTAN